MGERVCPREGGMDWSGAVFFFLSREGEDVLHGGDLFDVGYHGLGLRLSLVIPPFEKRAG